MNARLSLHLSCSPDAASEAVHAVEGFFSSHGLSETLFSSFALVLDEVISNIVSYAHEDWSGRYIDIFLTADGTEVTGEVVDDGKHFDPLREPERDVGLGLDERPLGGLGIMLVRRLMDRTTYERRSGKNHLTFAKARQGPPAGPDSAA